MGCISSNDVNSKDDKDDKTKDDNKNKDDKENKNIIYPWISTITNHKCSPEAMAKLQQNNEFKLDSKFPEFWWRAYKNIPWSTKISCPAIDTEGACPDKAKYPTFVKLCDENDNANRYDSSYSRGVKDEIYYPIKTTEYKNDPHNTPSKFFVVLLCKGHSRAVNSNFGLKRNASPIACMCSGLPMPSPPPRDYERDKAEGEILSNTLSFMMTTF